MHGKCSIDGGGGGIYRGGGRCRGEDGPGGGHRCGGLWVVVAVGRL